jgi:hypothetical protein
MSFICSNCGTRDNACWRNSHWFLHIQTCKIDDLDIWEPEIAKRLQEEKEFEDKGYYYKISKFGRVYRVPADLKDEYKRGHIQEHPKDGKQKRLLVGEERR